MGSKTRLLSPSPQRASVAGARRAPAPSTISPELASIAAQPPSGDRWLHEIKFDGYRMLAHLRDGTARLVSRNDHDWTARFPEIATALGRLARKRGVARWRGRSRGPKRHYTLLRPSERSFRGRNGAAPLYDFRSSRSGPLGLHRGRFGGSEDALAQLLAQAPP